jgi:hypothetical protein
MSSRFLLILNRKKPYSSGVSFLDWAGAAPLLTTSALFSAFAYLAPAPAFALSSFSEIQPILSGNYK